MKKILIPLAALLLFVGCGPLSPLPSAEAAPAPADPFSAAAEASEPTRIVITAEPMAEEKAPALSDAADPAGSVVDPTSPSESTPEPEPVETPIPAPTPEPEPTSAPEPTPEPEPAEKPVPTPTPEPPTQPAFVLANGAGAVAKTFTLGERVVILDAREDWYLVESEEGPLLVERWFVRAEGVRDPEPYTGYARGDTEVYPDPYLEGEPLASLKKNTGLTVEDAFGILLRVTLDDGRTGYALSSSVSRKKLPSGSGGGSGGKDGGDIPLAAPRGVGAGAVRLGGGRLHASEEATPSAGVVLAEGAEGYAALFQRDDEVRVLERGEETCSLLIDGRRAQMASWLLRFGDEAPFESFTVYAKAKAPFHRHCRLLDEPTPLTLNTELCVVGETPRGYIVRLKDELGYVPFSEVSLRRISAGSGSSGGDWTDPVL